MEAAKELTAEALYQEATFDDLEFQTTTDLEVLPTVIGQPRAVEAVQFSIGIAEEGYNVFVLGPTGVGRHALVKQSFCDKAATEAPPADWVYVNNFEETYKPHALRLPPGRGRTLQHDMEQLVDEIQTALSTAFESEEYQARRQEGEQQHGQHRLAHEARAARRPHREVVAPGAHAARGEAQRLAAQLVALHPRTADLGRGAQRGQVLAQEA